MSQDNMVVVGSGHAGARAVQALRANNWRGRITLIDGEGCTPYERPPLSKAVLKGHVKAEDAPLFPTGFLDGNDVELLTGVEAVAIDRPARQLHLSSGGYVDYHRLLLATGAEPRELDIPGKELGGSHSLRNAGDAARIAPHLKPGADIVIVGGGLIGLEVAASATAHGCNVTVIEAGPRLMTRAVPERLAHTIRHFHESKAVRFVFGRQAGAFLGDDGVLRALRLDDGTTLPCTVAVISIGVRPRTALAEAAGLDIDNGIAVDRFLRTSDPSIYAAGDACSFVLASGKRMRLECWKNAEDQGVVVARNMLGADEPYIPSPWMWSDQFDRTMQIAGQVDGAAHVERHCADGTLLIYHLDENRMILGVSGFGSIREVSRGVRTGQLLMEKDVRPGNQALSDPDFDLRTFAKAAVA